MSETKFTPGPWKSNRDGYVYSVSTGEKVCSPHSTLPDDAKMSEHIKDLKANAHLIAAAPELYETLEAIIARWDTPLWKDIEPTAVFINKGRAALTKARGEA